MARAATRIYVPLDVNFFDDERIIRAGEAAGWLYLAMCAKAKQLDTDGALDVVHLERLHVRGWQKRLATLVEVGAVEHTTADIYVIAGWLKWNESKEQRAARLKAERDRKANKKGAADSDD